MNDDWPTFTCPHCESENDGYIDDWSIECCDGRTIERLERKAEKWRKIAGDLAGVLNYVGWVNDSDGNVVCPWCAAAFGHPCNDNCSKQAALARFYGGEEEG